MQGSRYNPQKQHILDALDLAQLIGEQIQLKRSGKEYRGLCPFHDDSRPSFYVNPSKGIFKCFACGEGGNAISWLQKYFRMERGEAWKFLSERTGIDLPAPAQRGTRRTERSSARPSGEFDEQAELAERIDPAAIMEAHATALSFFRTILKHNEHGETARAVLTERGISDDMIERFELGAAPGGDRWDGLVQTLTRKGLSIELFLASGLVSRRRSGDGYYDRFRNRVIFPIHDLLGRPIAFGGRKVDPEDEPKYLNSPEHPRFYKSSTLYALHLAQQAIVKERTAIVVEGYTDVIACHAVGIENVVATLGTALTRDHVRVLQRHCDRVVLLFDGDTAGQSAADRAVENFFQSELDVAIALLPEQRDPADVLEQPDGKSELLTLVADATDAVDFLFDLLAQNLSASGSSVSMRQRTIQEFLARLGMLGFHQMTPIRRDLLLSRLSMQLHMPRESILQSIPKPRRSRTDDRAASEKEEARAIPTSDDEPSHWPAPLRRGRHVAERAIVGCVLAVPSLIDEIIDEQGIVVRDLIAPGRFRNPVHRTIIDTCLDLSSHGYSDEQPLPEFDDPQINEAVSDAYWTVHRETGDAEHERVRESLRAYLHSLDDYELEERRLGLDSRMERDDSAVRPPYPEESPPSDEPSGETEEETFARIRQLQQFHSQNRHRPIGPPVSVRSANYQSRIVEDSSAPGGKKTTTIPAGNSSSHDDENSSQGEGAS